MNGRQISSMEPLLFPFFSSPVDGSIKLIRPSVIIRTSSTLSRALLNHPTEPPRESWRLNSLRKR
ncbi:hypothetical protein BX29_01655 [Escherichia coli O45:H2 str. 2009C-4780]|nr:hypothetical protein BX56_08705 [Escherichia coli O45:H2 str. 2010C-3876]EZE70543.1 hypothetical protein BX29_01655 [Escherichia coli O45:H2 str. 2009C-4780]